MAAPGRVSVLRTESDEDNENIPTRQAPVSVEQRNPFERRRQRPASARQQQRADVDLETEIREFRKRYPSPQRSAAAGTLAGPAQTTEASELQQLSDACQELNSRINRYEEAANRPVTNAKAPPVMVL